MRSAFFAVLSLLPFFTQAAPFSSSNHHHGNAKNPNPDVGFNMGAIMSLVMIEFFNETLAILPANGTDTSAIAAQFAAQKQTLENLAQVPQSLDCQVNLDTILKSTTFTNEADGGVLALFYLELMMTMGGSAVLDNSTLTLSGTERQTLLNAIGQTSSVAQGFAQQESLAAPTITSTEFAILLHQFDPSCGDVLGTNALQPSPDRSFVFVSLLGTPGFPATIGSVCPGSECFCQIIDANGTHVVSKSNNGTIVCPTDSSGNAVNLVYVTSTDEPLSNIPETRAGQDAEILLGPTILLLLA